MADLANLSLNEAELARMQHDMDEILTHMDKLAELDTATVEPMAQVLYQAGATATLREDREIPERLVPNAEALVNSKTSGQGYFKVPRVIER